MNERKLFHTFCHQNFGRDPDAIHRWESDEESDPKIEVWIWNDQPEIGLITAVTYGLSTFGHDEWYMGRPELMIRLETEDGAWPLSIAYLAEVCGGELAFDYGTVLNLDEPIAEDSSMSGFVLYAPPLMDGEEMTCETGDELPIQLTGCYPIYEGEAKLIADDFDKFWNDDDYDLFSVTRGDRSA